jgi:hypothetical protein
MSKYAIAIARTAATAAETPGGESRIRSEKDKCRNRVRTVFTGTRTSRRRKAASATRRIKGFRFRRT